MNHVILIGRLARDGELRYIPGNGRPVWNGTIAVDRNYSKEKKAELQAKGQPTADFIRVIAWGKLGETCANNLTKGRLIAVDGSIQTSSYTAADGSKRYSTDVLAKSIEFLSSNNTGQAPADDFNFGNYNPDDFQAIEDDEDIPF